MDNLIKQLRIAVDRLTYPSESDEPFDVFVWPSMGSAQAAVQANAKSTAISEQSLGAFFDELLADAQSERFRALRKLLEANLSGVGVFRVDRGSEKDIYIIGQGSAGEWKGVKTMSVET